MTDKEPVLQHVYNNLLNKYEKDVFFDTYIKFLNFCNTDFTIKGGLNQYLNEPNIEMQNKIINMVNKYILENTTSKEPIIYSTVKHRRNSF